MKRAVKRKLPADLPSRLAAHCHNANTDPEFLSARNDIALCDTRIADMIRRVDDGGGAKLWACLKVAFDAYTAARDTGRVEAMKDSLEKVEKILAQGNTESLLWTAIMDMIERRRQLCETEHKRLVAMRHMMTEEQVMVMIETIVSTVKTAVQRYADSDTARVILKTVSAQMKEFSGKHDDATTH